MAYLLLEDGTVFEGEVKGCARDVCGEVVFSTGMTGYPELLTDPASFGEIVVMTYPLIGNYGINPEDFESERVSVRALVVRELCEEPSNWKCKQTLGSFLEENGVVCLTGIDTRHLARHIREHGAMRGSILLNEPTKQDVENLKGVLCENFVEEVSCKEAYVAAEGSPFVAIVDYGVKKSLIEAMVKRGLGVKVYPADTGADVILADVPCGILLSDGPGVPELSSAYIEEVKKLFGKLPILGIGFGHILLGLADGATAIKMKSGHHGGNYPVKELATDRVYITAQSHGYLLDETTLNHGKMTYVNWNDKTCEGVRYEEVKAIGVQFHPKGEAGSQDSAQIFDEFIAMLNERK